jgi:hypothetical protein
MVVCSYVHMFYCPIKVFVTNYFSIRLICFQSTINSVLIHMYMYLRISNYVHGCHSLIVLIYFNSPTII